MSRKLKKLEGLVVVTGASSGIGLELAKRAASDGVDLLLAADRDLSEAAREARTAGAGEVETIECDLGTEAGVTLLVERIGARPVAALFANAGQGANGPFLDQDWDTALHIINTNVTGTLRLIHLVGRRMRERGAGRIMVTGSIAGHIPGSFQLVYNSTKAFLNDFCIGLRDELRSSGVSVTVLEPGATDTNFFRRAHMENTRVGQQDKAAPSTVAAAGYAAMLADEDQVITGFMNKVRTVFADILPDETVAAMQRRMAEPLDP